MSPSSDALPGTKLPLAWSHGRAEIWALGATMHHLELRLPGGDVVRPLAEAPWHGDRRITGDRTIPAHLRYLGGEWPCVPFGKGAGDAVVHGYGTDNVWRLMDAGQGRAVWEIVYPADRPVERLRREISGVHGHPAVDLLLTVTARRDGTLPVGLHPILRLPDPGQGMGVEGLYGHGETFPVVFEPGVSRLAPAARFGGADALPLADGSLASLADLASLGTEEAFQLFGAGGDLRILYPAWGFATRIIWNPQDFPTCLFWLSAGGREAKPWEGRFRGLGVEPLDARFEERDGAGIIAGGRRFRAGEVWTTRYRIAVEPL